VVAADGARRRGGRPLAEVVNDYAVSLRSEDEGWRVRKDGSRFWANVVITALPDQQGGSGASPRSPATWRGGARPKKGPWG
jgi:hypothetical protein